MLKIEIIDNSLLLGQPRAIRSDEYLVGTPIIISQDISGEPTINENIGIETNLVTNYNVPTRNIFSFFKPATWIFYFSDNVAFNYSFFWWIRIAIMLIGLYLLLMELTHRNIFISILGSLIFIFSPFIQWWLSVDPMAVIGFVSFGLFFFVRLLKSKSNLNSLLYSLGLSYSIVSFALILYPPFQIPVAWVALFIALGIILDKRKNILKSKTEKIRFIASLLSSIVVVSCILFAFYLYSSNVFSIMMNTTYPGERFFSAGLGSVVTLLSGFYNILMQRDSNGPLYGNQSEAANFLIVFFPLLIWIVYKNIKILLNKKSIDYLGLCVGISLIFLSSWYLLPIPDIISRYTALYMVLPQRIFIGVGFANYLLLIHVLTKNIYKIKKAKYDEYLLAFLLLIGTGIIYYLVGDHFYSINPPSLASPAFLSPIIKIILVSLFVPLLLFILLTSFKKIFIFLFLFYGIISSALVNPLYQGVDIIRNTDVAEYIQKTAVDRSKRWVIYDDIYLAQYALANDANLLNGVHLYPQFDMWDILDPNQNYINIYNRYAHILVTNNPDQEEEIQLTAMDSVQINIDPCDTRLNKLRVEFVVSRYSLDNNCLNLLKAFEENDIYIYQIKDSSI